MKAGYKESLRLVTSRNAALVTMHWQPTLTWLLWLWSVTLYRLVLSRPTTVGRWHSTDWFYQDLQLLVGDTLQIGFIKTYNCWSVTLYRLVLSRPTTVGRWHSTDWFYQDLQLLVGDTLQIGFIKTYNCWSVTLYWLVLSRRTTVGQWHYRLVLSRRTTVGQWHSTDWFYQDLQLLVGDTLQIGFIKTYNCCYVICAM